MTRKSRPRPRPAAGDMAETALMSPQSSNLASRGGGEPEQRAREDRPSHPALIRWAAWDTPDRIAARQDIRNEPGDAQPRLMLITHDNGALRISATRRPVTMLTDAARMALAMGTWIDGALVSEPDVKHGLIAQTLVKRLRLGGHRYIGGGVFERLAVDDALATLAPIRAIAVPPEAPRPFRPETDTPAFLRKETPMFNEETVQPAGLPSLVVANTAIRQDREGRYCLNDLHKAAVASGANQRTKEPGKFLASPQTIELVNELETAQIPGSSLTDTQNLGIAPVNTIKGGLQQGTYVCKELVYAYAMWISAKFHLTVIRAFDALVSGRTPEVGYVVHPEISRAARMTAWRIANEMRELYLSAMGAAKRQEDEERAWEAFAAQMERIEENLIAKGREMARKHNLQTVCAWIMAWKPEARGRIAAF